MNNDILSFIEQEVTMDDIKEYLAPYVKKEKIAREINHILNSNKNFSTKKLYVGVKIGKFIYYYNMLDLESTKREHYDSLIYLFAKFNGENIGKYSSGYLGKYNNIPMYLDDNIDNIVLR